MNELEQWLAYAPEAERFREALLGTFADLPKKIAKFERAMRRLVGHRYIMARKIRKAYGL